MTQEIEPMATTETRSALDAIFDADDDGLLEIPEKVTKLSSAERLQRSFLEINDFFRTFEREPSATTREIAERKLGARLDGIRMNPEKIDALRHIDEFNLLKEPSPPASLEDLLSEDGIDLLEDPTGLLDTTALPRDRRRHSVTGTGAQRIKCDDFDQYAPLFVQKHEELRSSQMKLIPFRGRHSIKPGAFFVLQGVVVFVAEVGETEYKKTTVRENRRERLRLIFENGTESAMYRQSLSLRLAENDAGFEIVPSVDESILADDEATGWVYVLRSLSNDPSISGRSDLYKIGFTTTPVARRISNATKEPTYLMAPVEVVAEYRTYNMKTSVLEHLLHRVFSDARLRINQTGQDGKKYDVTEWFEVPLPTINNAINLISTGEIVNFVYDPVSRRIRVIGEEG